MLDGPEKNVDPLVDLERSRPRKRLRMRRREEDDRRDQNTELSHEASRAQCHSVGTSRADSSALEYSL